MHSDFSTARRGFVSLCIQHVLRLTDRRTQHLALISCLSHFLEKILLRGIHIIIISYSYNAYVFLHSNRLNTMKSFSILITLSGLLIGIIGSANAQQHDSCTVLESCHRCTDGDRRDHPECQSTGIISITKCSTQEDESIIYQVCQRTKADDEFLMIQLQMFCLVLGVVSFLSVRRQRTTASSLFDQRQRMRTPKATGNNNNNNNNNNGAIELGTTSKTRNNEGVLSRMNSRDEEKVPLTQQLDVI